jgi:hypothetical protein
MQQQNQNNMITSIDKIPLKSSSNGQNTDDLTDPIVRDVLNEFEHELSLHEKQSKYTINDNKIPEQQIPSQPLQQQQYQPSQYTAPPQQKQQTQSINYINNELLTKTFIICIVIALITNPYIYETIINKIPSNISSLLDTYNYIIKIIILFISIYAMMFYNLI